MIPHGLKNLLLVDGAPYYRGLAKKYDIDRALTPRESST